MRVKLDEGAIKPHRAHTTDAGLDLFSRETKVVPARGSAVFDTGVHIELTEEVIPVNERFIHVFETVGFLKSKSGLNVKHGITSEGVIDMGYTGAILVNLINHSDKDYTVRKGDKISQLVILPILTPHLQVVDELEETERGNGGFGSTGR